MFEGGWHDRVWPCSRTRVHTHIHLLTQVRLFRFLACPCALPPPPPWNIPRNCSHVFEGGWHNHSTVWSYWTLRGQAGQLLPFRPVSGDHACTFSVPIQCQCSWHLYHACTFSVPIRCQCRLTLLHPPYVRLARAVCIHRVWLGWARTIYLYVYTMYIRCFKQENHHTMVIYGVYIRFWPNLCMTVCLVNSWQKIPLMHRSYIRGSGQP